MGWGASVAGSVVLSSSFGGRKYCSFFHSPLFFLRGLPYMTSSQKGEGQKMHIQFADKQYRFCGQTRERGSKRSKIMSYMEAPLGGGWSPWSRVEWKMRGKRLRGMSPRSKLPLYLGVSVVGIRSHPFVISNGFVILIYFNIKAR